MSGKARHDDIEYVNNGTRDISEPYRYAKHDTVEYCSKKRVTETGHYGRYADNPNNVENSDYSTIRY